MENTFLNVKLKRSKFKSNLNVQEIKIHFPFREVLSIVEKINVSSCASCQIFLHSFFLSGFALAIILIQCLVSFASFFQIVDLFVIGILDFTCHLDFEICYFLSWFIRRIDPLGFGIGIGLIDEVDRHIIAHVPDFFRLQFAFEIGHGRAGDAVHNLVI